jgi:hypothetical protein
MSAKFYSVGVIRLEPYALHRTEEACDDSTLDLLMASLSHRGNLADAPILRRQSVKLMTGRRLDWSASSERNVSLRANTAQLVDDLQAEFDRVESSLL